MSFPHFKKLRLEAIKRGKTKCVLSVGSSSFKVNIGNALVALDSLSKQGKVTWKFK